MQFIKKHYEKVLLSIVLLGLAVAAAALPLQVSGIRRALDETVTGVGRTKPKPFKPIDLSTNEVIVRRFASTKGLQLSGAHNILNPVQWKKRPDGGLIKISTGNELGAGAIEVMKIDELKMTVSFEIAAGGPENAEPRYIVTVSRDTEANPKKRTVSQKTPKGEFFNLLRVEGPPEAPTSLVLQLKDENEPITIAKDQSYVRPIGYAADLRYPPEKQTFLRKRKDDTITLQRDSETYKIVAISPNQVVLSAKSTQKRTPLKSNASLPLK